MLQPLPLHPLFVHAPAALIPLAALTDVIVCFGNRHKLEVAADWLWMFAAIGTPLASAAGWLWWWQMEKPTSDVMDLHQWLGTGLALVVPMYAVARARWLPRVSVRTADGLRFGSGLLLTILVVVQGHAGAVLTFGAAESDRVAPSQPATTPSAPTDDGWHDYLDLKEPR